MPRGGINQSFGRSHSIADSKSIDSILAYINCLQIYIHDARTNIHIYIYMFIYSTHIYIYIYILDIVYYIISIYILIIHFILHNTYACLYQPTYALHTHVYVYIYMHIGTQYIIHPSIRFIACVSRQPTRFAPWNPCWDIRCLAILTFPQQNCVETWQTWRQSTVENGFYGFIYQQKIGI